jgi:hypothetical protein
MLSVAEITRRKPVWQALAELWLDTALSEDDVQRIAEVLRASGYSVGELRLIYLKEVAPVVYRNAFSVAGAWSGFDSAWLSKEAAKRAEASPTCWDSRWNAKQRIMTYATEHYWKQLERLLS